MIASLPSAFAAFFLGSSYGNRAPCLGLLFSPFVTTEEKREGEPQIVSFPLRNPPVSVMIVISSLYFFLCIGTPMEKLKTSTFMGPVKFPIN